MPCKGQRYYSDRNTKATAKDADCRTFAEILNKLMNERGINSTTLSEETGLNPGSISKYLSGERAPTLNSIIALSKYFRVDCHYLLTGTKQKNASVSQATGLSDVAIDKLKEIRHKNRTTWLMDAVNALIEDGNFESLIVYLSKYLSSSSHIIKYDYVVVDYHDLLEQKTKDIFRDMLLSLNKSFKENHPVDDRVFYSILYDKYEAGEITKEQLKKTIREFENSNYDYNPLDNQ